MAPDFSFWDVIILGLIIFWPATICVVIAFLVLAWLGTKNAGWRVFWIIAAIATAMPLIWYVAEMGFIAP
ncbi:hypothetical protein ABDF71_27205 [Ochrobactrum sp. WV_118_8]|uniref:hypothetical protein n=1 Tax=Brucella anthropi TaxID=529 RepID=UPI00188AC435|nr:hypothetical protein [Brucella anthropi]QPA29872.1 hypothetical protein IR196_22800 [Brucella anthropi]